MRLGGISITLVDTPGFDDTTRSDSDILRQLSEWLVQSYKEKQKLNGILYFHRITDLRMQGSVLSQIHSFQKLCGDKSLKNVVLATTFWSKVPVQERSQALPTVEEDRERELAANDTYWGHLIRRGAQMIRLPENQAAAHDLLSQIALNDSIYLEVQKEMGQKGKSFEETAAAQEQEIIKLQNELRESLSKEQTELSEKLRQKEKEVRKLTESISKEVKQVQKQEKKAQKTVEKEGKRQERQDASERRSIKLDTWLTKREAQSIEKDMDRRESNLRKIVA